MPNLLPFIRFLHSSTHRSLQAETKETRRKKKQSNFTRNASPSKKQTAKANKRTNKQTRKKDDVMGIYRKRRGKAKSHKEQGSSRSGRIKNKQRREEDIEIDNRCRQGKRRGRAGSHAFARLEQKKGSNKVWCSRGAKEKVKPELCWKKRRRRRMRETAFYLCRVVA